MTAFELLYLASEPFLPPLPRLVRRQLLGLCRGVLRQPGAAAAETDNPDGCVEVLDVGGRKSHYTIGLPAEVTISDLPRESEIQKQLHLGLDAASVARTETRRSNVRSIVFDDMTESRFEDGSFDLVVAVEVLEHVDEDELFVRQVQRVLRPGGVFLMTTPNGDYVENTNPDHRRHYRRGQLQELLERSFGSVRCEYAVRDNVFYRASLYSWSPRRPLRTVLALLGGWAASLPFGRSVADRAQGTQHLLAVARQPAD